MASGYAPLPAYQNPANAMVNFQPVSDALDSYQKGMTVAGESTAKINAANAMAAGEYQKAQGYLAQVDPRAAMEVGLYPGKLEEQGQKLEKTARELLGAHAQTLSEMKDPTERAAAMTRWAEGSPKVQAGLAKAGIDWRANPDLAIKHIYQNALGAQDPEQQKLIEAQTGKANREKYGADESIAVFNPTGTGQTAAGNAGQTSQVAISGGTTLKTQEQRKAAADALGLREGSVERNAVMINGKLPDVVPDHKAIQAADEQVRASDSLIQNLKTALDYSKAASSGLMAKTGVAQNTIYGGTEGTRAAAQFDNVVQSAVLPGLKALFGARVTNIDVQLSKDLAGASTQPPEVREAILRRAINRANELRAEKSVEASQLREQQYYKPGGGAALPQTSAANAIRAAREALAKGADRDAVIKRLNDKGFDPSGL